MSHIIFEKMKSLIPEKKCQKFRKDEEFTLVTNSSNKMVYLNAVAGDIFLAFDGQKTLEEIFHQMLSEYDVSPEKLEEDFVKIIRDFQWNRIIELRRT